MPFYDETGRAIGIVTMSDLSKAVESPEQLTEALREMSEPHRARKEPTELEAGSPSPGADGGRELLGSAA